MPKNKPSRSSSPPKPKGKGQTRSGTSYKTLKKQHENDTFTDEEIQLANQLQNLGLEIREITADGNCLFSSVSDQMYGSEKKAKELRTCSCLYILQNKERFLPFIGENDAEFKRFIKMLNTEGVYGGQEALVAISNENNVKISIHQVGQPIWTIQPDNPKNVKKEIHLAYHSRALHYSSVRRKGDINCAASNITLPSESSSSSKTRVSSSTDVNNNSRKNRRKNGKKRNQNRVNVEINNSSKEAENLSGKINI